MYRKVLSQVVEVVVVVVVGSWSWVRRMWRKWMAMSDQHRPSSNVARVARSRGHTRPTTIPTIPYYPLDTGLWRRGFKKRTKYQFLRLIKISSGQAMQCRWHESPKKGKRYSVYFQCHAGSWPVIAPLFN